MDTNPGKKRFTAAVNFRTTAQQVGDIMDYQAKRKLREQSDASRELMQVGIEMHAAHAEAKAMGLDPAQALRAAIAAKISNP